MLHFFKHIELDKAIGRLIKHIGPWLTLTTVIVGIMPTLLTTSSTSMMLTQTVWLLFRINSFFNKRKTIQERCHDGTYLENEPMNRRKHQRIIIKSVINTINIFCFLHILILVVKQFTSELHMFIRAATSLADACGFGMGLEILVQSMDSRSSLNIATWLLQSQTIILSTLLLGISGIISIFFYRYQQHQLLEKATAFNQRWKPINNRIGLLQNLKEDFMRRHDVSVRRTAHWIGQFVGHFFILTATILYLSGYPIHYASMGQFWAFNETITPITKLQLSLSLIATTFATERTKGYKPLNADYLCHKVAEIARVSWVSQIEEFTVETTSETATRNAREATSREGIIEFS